MIPKDIESGEQFQVRWEPMGAGEIARSGTKAQMTFLWRGRQEFGAVMERRTITVSAWEPFNPDAPESDEPIGPCGYGHDGDCTINCSERAARDSLRAVGVWPDEDDDEADG